MSDINPIGKEIADRLNQGKPMTPSLRVEQCESWGKHALDIKIGDEWCYLHTDYAAVVEPMKNLIASAIRFLEHDNAALRAECELRKRDMDATIKCLEAAMKRAEEAEDELKRRGEVE